MTRHSVIIGTGSYLPSRVVTNDELAQTVDTSDKWIRTRTGICQRHIAEKDQLTSDLAYEAGLRALNAANVSASDLDAIIVATTTPDNTFPATAAKVQAKLGNKGCAAFDLQAVCSGFIYALSVADNMIRAGQAAHVLIIGAEKFSCMLDWNDRTTCVLFGDGAGAVVLKSADGAPETIRDGNNGILSTHLHSDGSKFDILYADGGVATTQTAGVVKMSGKEVFKHAVVNLAAVANEALEANGYTKEDIDWLVPHQANKRIIDGTGKKLGLPAEKVVVTVDRHANTSAASIPLALDEAVRDGRIQPGNLVLMESMGAGMSWGSCLLRW